MKHSTQPGDLAPLEKALGHTFAHPELLVQALTHRSHAHEAALKTTGKPDQEKRFDNQRLEFLGDAVLGLVVAELLFERHPGWQEGELTRMRAQFVNREALAQVAKAISLGDYLYLSHERGRAHGRENVYILANAMEAVLAAMYLDASTPGVSTPSGESLAGGSLDPVRRFVQTHVLGKKADKLAKELSSGGALRDFKSALQLHLQAHHIGMPIYRLLSQSGPDHRKQFEVGVLIRTPDGEEGTTLADGRGESRKKAEQNAARKALEFLTRQPMHEVPPVPAELAGRPESVGIAG
jgi:ribonuclease-3